jgi:hypothetical protein
VSAIQTCISEIVMQVFVRWLQTSLAVLLLSVIAGCGGSTEPNPNLTPPEIPPSTRGQKGGVLKSDLSKKETEKTDTEKK